MREFDNVERAWATFRLKYSGLPGDIKNPTRFFPACDLILQIGDNSPIEGDGNGEIDMEMGCVWMHFAASGLYNPFLKAYSHNYGNQPDHDLDFASGEAYSYAGWPMHELQLMNIHSMAGSAPFHRGHILEVSMDGYNTTWPISPQDLAAIDSKIDDGKPLLQGKLLSGAGASCYTNADIDTNNPTATSEYIMTETERTCSILYYLN